MSKKTKCRLPEEQTIYVNRFAPKNKKQEELVKSIKDNEITIAIGSSGSGKTFCSVATALELLNEGYKRIILIKSVTTIPGEDLGFIPGSYDEKMLPFMMSYSGNIDKLLGKDSYKDLLHKGLIEVLPIAYIRGLSIDDSIVIFDEAQNTTPHTFKTIITRIGTNSKYIILGDIEQVDRKNKKESCLSSVVEIFRESDCVGTIEFTDEDCVRNPIIPKILQKLREHNI